jgi:hypothetical protein
MDKNREHGTRIEDLPVETEQAAEVRGGLNFTRLGGAIVPDAPDRMTVPDAPELQIISGGA